jgi:hypothetical protein
MWAENSVGTLIHSDALPKCVGVEDVEIKWHRDQYTSHKEDISMSIIVDVAEKIFFVNQKTTIICYVLFVINCRFIESPSSRIVLCPIITILSFDKTTTYPLVILSKTFSIVTVKRSIKDMEGLGLSLRDRFKQNILLNKNI